MGKIRKGLLGSFSGKVGNLVGSRWRGIAIIRSSPVTTKRWFTQKQLDQQGKFALMVHFLQPLTALLNQTFAWRAKAMPAFSRAISCNIRQCITGHYPAFTIDFSRVQLGRGNLQGIGFATCISSEADKLVFSWPNSSDVYERATDMVFLAIYFQDTNQWIYNLGIAQRFAETATLEVKGFRNKSVQTWLGFISSDGTRASNGFYTGMVTVS